MPLTQGDVLHVERGMVLALVAGKLVGVEPRAPGRPWSAPVRGEHALGPGVTVVKVGAGPSAVLSDGTVLLFHKGAFVAVGTIT